MPIRIRIHCNGMFQGEKERWDLFILFQVPHYYRNVHAVVYVYDITKRSTFDSLDNWLSEYSRHSLNENVPRILVGE